MRFVSQTPIQVRATIAGLELLLTLPGAFFRSACFVVDELHRQSVTRELTLPGSVLLHPALQVDRRPDVQRPVRAFQNVCVRKVHGHTLQNQRVNVLIIYPPQWMKSFGRESRTRPKRFAQCGGRARRNPARAGKQADKQRRAFTRLNAACPPHCEAVGWELSAGHRVAIGAVGNRISGIQGKRAAQ